jgi:hypothetical protein
LRRADRVPVALDPALGIPGGLPVCRQLRGGQCDRLIRPGSIPYDGWRDRRCRVAAACGEPSRATCCSQSDRPKRETPRHPPSGRSLG